MLSDALGHRGVAGGREYLDIAVGVSGHAVAMQYEHHRPGVYRVDFALEALDPDSGASSDICAVLDVTAAAGAAMLARHEVRRGDLGDGRQTISLTFTLRDFRALEYRVDSTGTTALRVWEPTIAKISDEIGNPPPVDVGAATQDPLILHQQVRKVLRLLRPHAVRGFEKTRLGNMGDGGYVCIDDFEGIDTAFSFGINDDISWDRDAVARGLTVYQFDHTVDDPAPDEQRMVFEKKMIGPVSNSDAQNLADLVDRHDKRRTRPNVMLKMDIEGAEWPLIEATTPEVLGRFSQIVCEIHCLGYLNEVEWRRLIYPALRKINEHYAVFHVHANVCGGIANIGNVIFPHCIEVSFANRAVYELAETEELFPGPMDISCDANQPDMFLGSFRF